MRRYGRRYEITLQNKEVVKRFLADQSFMRANRRRRDFIGALVLMDDGRHQIMCLMRPRNRRQICFLYVMAP